MTLTRRDVFVLGSAAFAGTALAGMPAFASATDDLIAEFTGGAEAGSGALVLTAPEIAENGNTVPIEVDAPGAVAVAIFADGNPVPAVATFNFRPAEPVAQCLDPYSSWPKARTSSPLRRWKTDRSCAPTRP